MDVLKRLLLVLSKTWLNSFFKIVSFYGRKIDNKYGRHYYTNNRKGLFPYHLFSNVEILILTESIIDALTLKEWFIKINNNIKTKHSLKKIT